MNSPWPLYASPRLLWAAASPGLLASTPLDAAITSPVVPCTHALRSSAAGGSTRDDGQQRGGLQLVVVAFQQLAGRTDGLRTALRESYLQFKDYRW
jgi:hypothetical protein